MKQAIIVIDIGMTNKKIAVYDEHLVQRESVYKEFSPIMIKGPSGDIPTHDIDGMKKWFIENIRLFAKEYPEIEIRRLLEKVHYANTYEDKMLKEIAFLVDEISEYMFKLEVANRDFVVGYFNTLIIDPNIEPTEYNFVLMEVDSLIENSFVEVPEEE